MQDKDMVNDILTQINSSLTEYASAISQSSNPQVRQTIQSIRDSSETFQYDLFKLAEEKGFYKPAQKADSSDIDQVKSLFVS